jgi:hypothetical protein
MNPDSPHTTGGPTPAVQTPIVTTEVAAPSQPLPEHLTAAQQATAHAKKLVEQYQGNPFMLNQELDKLKTDYLAKEFHITITAAEE